MIAKHPSLNCSQGSLVLVLASSRQDLKASCKSKSPNRAGNCSNQNIPAQCKLLTLPPWLQCIGANVSDSQ